MMSKLYQLVSFESDDECSGSRGCTLLKKLGIRYETESIRERVGSALLPRWWIVKAWVATSDIPKLEKALAAPVAERTGR